MTVVDFRSGGFDGSHRGAGSYADHDYAPGQAHGHADADWTDDQDWDEGRFATDEGAAGLTGRDIGAIQIHERHSLVEIPEHAADDVLRSLRGATTLKGRKANIRRDRGFAPSGGPRRGGRHD